jgi:hypothetical protein
MIMQFVKANRSSSSGDSSFVFFHRDSTCESFILTIVEEVPTKMCEYFYEKFVMFKVEKLIFFCRDFHGRVLKRLNFSTCEKVRKEKKCDKKFLNAFEVFEIFLSSHIFLIFFIINFKN